MTSKDKARVNKQRYIEMKGGKCADCGGVFHQCCYHFDHRDVTQKVFNLSDHMHWDFERVKDELEKCDLVCANCHALRTFVHKREAVSKKQGNAQRGKKLSLEARRHMSEAQKGHSLSIEARMRISESRTGQINTPAGWHHTPETKEKLHQIALARPKGWKHKPETIEKMKRTQRARAEAAYVN